MPIASSRDTIAATPATNALVSAISPSKQFAAYAHDQSQASVLCVYAERVKREWLRRMNLPDQWRDPILFAVRSREPAQTNAPAISLVIFQTDEHLKYQVHCLVPPPLDQTELLTKTIEALCAEWVNREQPIVRGETYTAPLAPLWLVQGLAESMQGRGDLLLATARASIATDRVLPASDLLTARLLPSDPAELQLFQANAWLFTDGLLALPNGAQKLQGFLKELGAQKVDSNAFWAVYRQDFPQDTAFEKWWGLEQASRISFVLAENLTAEETARRLDRILLTKLDFTHGQDGVPEEMDTTVDQLWRYTDNSWLEGVLKMKINRLGALRSQAHPFYQPVIDDYREALSWLTEKNTVRFRRGIRKAEAKHFVAEKQSREITAYMNQVEARP